MSKYQIQRFKQTVTIADGQTVGVGSAFEVNGLLKGITAIVPALTGTTTAKIEVKDADGTVVYTKDSIAEGATYSAFIDANNQPLELPLSGSHTITVTASNTQTGDKAIPVVLLIQRG